MLFTDICCLQEHFLMTSKNKKHSNTDKIRKEFGQSCDMFISPATKSNSLEGQRGDFAPCGKRDLQSMYQRLKLRTQEFRQPNSPLKHATY